MLRECSLFIILLFPISASLYSQECKVDIIDVDLSDLKEIWINGKMVAENVSTSKENVEQTIIFNGGKYIPIRTVTELGGWEYDGYIVFCCEQAKLVAEFCTSSIMYGYKNGQDYIKFKKQWKADFFRMKLIDLDENKEIPMTLDAEKGFFPEQKISPETEEDELPPPTIPTASATKGNNANKKIRKKTKLPSPSTQPHPAKPARPASTESAK